ncbi:hypothetical protein FA13DRAFT_1771256 [Coprinellus micaceus]|uniref:CHAT domain-containing protein n=1 Tax=Coprinellus micaceus TaxID=71717 RepID=A0A4Y7TS19_COPMI|nr:hypothetical protein FA13DRAFT_1771256 [Coprinellus micaceus]
MDISLECVALAGEHGESLSLAELWIFGVPGSEEGICIALTRTAPNKWEVAGAIEVPYEVDGIDCIAKDEDGEDIGFLHLDCKKMRIAGTRPGHRVTQILEHWNGPCGSLTMSWEVAQKKSMVVELKHLNISITALQKAVEWMPTHHPFLFSWLDDLARAFHHLFKRTGEPKDIAKAISALKKAARLTPKDHHDKLLNRYRSLATACTSLYKRTSNLTDLCDATLASQKVTELTSHDEADLPTNVLWNLLFERLERTGSVSDISQAISALQKAVDLTPLTHSNRPTRLGNLGVYICVGSSEAVPYLMLPKRFQSYTKQYGPPPKHTASLSDVAEAISVFRRALECTQEGYPVLPGLLGNLASALILRYGQGEDPTDISEAIAAQRRAVAITLPGDPSLPAQLSNLSTSLRRRYDHSGAIPDVDDAISTMREAIKLTPDGAGEPPCQAESAANSPSSPPRVKLEAAENWGRAVKRYDSGSTQVIDAFDVAISLIALIAGLEQTVEGRYEQLQNVSGIALEAAAAACKLERLDKVVEWLEQGRCLVWSQLNHLRTPLEDLRHHDASLEQKLHLAREWDEVLVTVRLIPGFESFLRPAPCSSLLRHLPLCGPIVVINLAGEQCDAIALLAELEELIHIPLPGFSLNKPNQYQSQLNAHVRSHGLRVREEQGAEDKLPGREGAEGALSVLRSLWVEVVKPVLDALGYSRTDTTGQKQPRIWWCPTSPLSFLPLHVAGIYEGRMRHSSDRPGKEIAVTGWDGIWIIFNEPTEGYGQDKECERSGPAHSLHSSIQALRHRIGDSEESILAWVPYVHFGY